MAGIPSGVDGIGQTTCGRGRDQSVKHLAGTSTSLDQYFLSINMPVPLAVEPEVDGAESDLIQLLSRLQLKVQGKETSQGVDKCVVPGCRPSLGLEL